MIGSFPEYFELVTGRLYADQDEVPEQRGVIG
jgi:hypothetical protein